MELTHIDQAILTRYAPIWTQAADREDAAAMRDFARHSRKIKEQVASKLWEPWYARAAKHAYYACDCGDAPSEHRLHELERLARG